MRLLTINGGSSSIKFAVFENGNPLTRIVEGTIERIGLPEATFCARGMEQEHNFLRSVTVANHTVAVEILMDWIEELDRRAPLSAVGHRMVYGGSNCRTTERITPELIEELHRFSPFDPEHLPAHSDEVGHLIRRKSAGYSD